MPVSLEMKSAASGAPDEGGGPHSSTRAAARSHAPCAASAIDDHVRTADTAPSRSMRRTSNCDAIAQTASRNAANVSASFADVKGGASIKPSNRRSGGKGASAPSAHRSERDKADYIGVVRDATITEISLSPISAR